MEILKKQAIDSESIETKIREQNQIETIRELQEYQSKMDIWGHGVELPATAEKIMKEGLKTKWQALHDFSYKLPLNDQKSLLHKLNGWDYHARTIIILISAPIDFDSSDYAGERDKSVADTKQLIFDHDFSLKKDDFNIVPPTKIVGYVDVNNFKFIKNPNFT